MSWPRWIRLPFRTVLDFFKAMERHSLFTHAAASAFFLFLSLPPALLALVSLIGLVPIERWGEAIAVQFLEGSNRLFHYFESPEIAQVMGYVLELHLGPILEELQNLSTDRVIEYIRELLGRTMPPDLARTLSGIAENILGNPRPGLLTVSFLVILWSASGVTRATLRAMTTIYEARPRIWIGRNTMALLLTVGFLAIWTVTLALLPVSNTLADVVVRALGLDLGVQILWSVLSWTVGGLLLFTTALVLNHVGPNLPLRWRATMPGSLLTVTLWVLLSRLLGQWMERNWHSYNTTYGTLAGVIVLLLWCYLICLGLLLGAELNTAILRLRAQLRGRETTADLAEATRLVVEEEAAEEQRDQGSAGSRSLETRAPESEPEEA